MEREAPFFEKIFIQQSPHMLFVYWSDGLVGGGEGGAPYRGLDGDPRPERGEFLARVVY